jgi:nucleoside-diphosphate-sugar epimerase
MKNISILGCGWFGLPLAKALLKLGYNVKGSTTSIDKVPILNDAGINAFLLNFNANEIPETDNFFETDILIICIPPKRKSTEFSDYPNKINIILNLAQGKSKNIIFVSSTSVYGDVNATVNENTIPIPDTDSGQLLLKTEQNFLNKNSFSKTILRFAGLIGPNRDPGRFFAGKTEIPNGLAPVNLIELEDALGVTIAIIEQQKFGYIYNACNANHPSRLDFYTRASIKSNLELPKFIKEKQAWKIIDSINISKYLGYEFKKEL